MPKRIAFVTGASRGIGRASALALAEAGFDVAVAARTLQPGESRLYGSTAANATVQSLPGSLQETAERARSVGARALAVQMDLLETSSIDSALDRIHSDFGEVDVLVNNAIYQGPGVMDRFLELEPLDVARVFEGNVFAQIHLTQCVLPSMIERGGGVVINMTSTAGRTDPPGPAERGGWGYAYAASKAALHRMAGHLHGEFSEAGIRAYNIDPGYVVTAALRSLVDHADELDARFKGDSPEVPARAIAWLAKQSQSAIDLAGTTLEARGLCERLSIPESSFVAEQVE